VIRLKFRRFLALIRFKHVHVDMQAVLREIDDARAEDAARRLHMGH
jgi:hypothetical protein